MNSVMIRSGALSPFDIIGESTFLGALSCIADGRHRIQAKYQLAKERGVDSLYGAYVLTLEPEEINILHRAWLEWEGHKQDH